jgi:Kef-type K+ transport system membrane component KefB
LEPLGFIYYLLDDLMKSIILILTAMLLLFAIPVLASEAELVVEHAESEGHGAIAITFLWIAVLLLAAKISGLVEKWGQPAVLGELVIGVILGNLVLLGVGIFEPIKHDSIITFFAEIGVVLLLFQIGLESNIFEMRKVGIRALLVAVIGVVAPFVLGTYLIGPWLLPGLDANTYLFLGATLTATSVGITARVFKDLGTLKKPESQIVLGAAVIDDVLGLIILAVISAIVSLGSVSVGAISWITAKSILFLVGAIVIGQFSAPYLGKLFSRISTGTGMKLTMALSFGLILAYLAGEIGLAPIVGAFAAGLVLDPVHFKFFIEPEIIVDIKEHIHTAPGTIKEKLNRIISKHSHKHVEDLLEPLGLLFAPIFFVVTGMSVDISTLFDTKILVIALAITVVAIFGKVLSGLVAGKVNKLIVGFGMVPRGEVGLIFAAIGRGLGVVNDQVFSIIVIMVILTTLITPPILALLIKRQAAAS